MCRHPDILPRHGQPKTLSARAQRHIQRLSLENRRMSAASTAAEVDRVGGQPVSAQTIRRTLHQIGSPPFRNWATGQYSNMIMATNPPPRRPLPC